MIQVKKLFEPRDMTQGEPWKQIALFSLPLLLGNIAQQLYNTVDSIVVGHYEGDNALAAVGSAGPIFNLLLVLFIGISSGVGIMVAQYFGARAREQLSNTIGTCMTLCAIASGVIMLITPPIIRPMLEMLNTPAAIIDDCTAYLSIMMYGVIGLAYYNILSGILRGLGDSFSGLLYLLVATVLNIILDILFVAAFGMGVAGVALATAIAQAISAFLCLRKLLQMKETFDLGISQLKIKKELAGRIVKLGLPTGATQAILSSAMIIVQSLTNSFGEMFIAANVIVMRVDGFAMLPNMSFAVAMTTYSGQNVGARQFDRVSKGAKQGLIMAVLCSTLITVTILIFGKYLMMIFTDTRELVELSVYIMRILAVGYIAVSVTQTLSGVMRGVGDTITPMWISLFTTVILRVPLAYGISYLTRTESLPTGRFECIALSLMISWVAGAVITTLVYRKGRWRRVAQQELA